MPHPKQYAPGTRPADRAHALLAPWVVVHSGQILGPGAGVVVEGGLIRETVEGESGLRRRAEAWGAPVLDLESGVLTAGLVNAHSHLELAALQGQVSPEGGFAAWIGNVLKRRGATSPELLGQGILRGAARLASTGTTTVGDIDSLGLAQSLLPQTGLRVVQYREVLDAWDPERTGQQIEQLQQPLASRPHFDEGLSPHAPFTVGPDLMRAAGQTASRRRLPVTVHWSETQAEVDWLAGRSSSLEELLGPGPGLAGLEHLAAGGLLGPRTSLVHGNWPQPGEPEALAAAGTSLVHCPGSHAFFDRESFPLKAYQAAGVNVALGTDSAASNEDLDVLRELQLLRAAIPDLTPAEGWAMATENGARALGLEGRVGRLVPGQGADLAWFLADSRYSSEVLDALTDGGPTCAGTWIAGQSQQHSSDASRAGARFDR